MGKMKNIIFNNAGLEGISKCSELSSNWDIYIDHSTIKVLETSRKRKWEKCKIQLIGKSAVKCCLVDVVWISQS